MEFLFERCSSSAKKYINQNNIKDQKKFNTGNELST